MACSYDDSLEYCTYDNPASYTDNQLGYSLMFIASKESELTNSKSFTNIEDLIERVISHETIHIVILELEGKDSSDKLDDLEISVTFGAGRTHIIRMNFLGYANDNTGLVTATL
ncbi:hypothetical protein [Candidatus Nitrosocosmicus sp. T]